jgi:ABC-2 type transport system permease protein
MAEALHAEWTKLRTLASSYWLLLAVAVCTVGVSAAAAAASSSHDGGYEDISKLSLTGIDLGQAVVVALGVLVISNEYSTGMMGVTLAALPRRLLVLAAKATAVTGLRIILPKKGFTIANGYALISLGHGPTLRAAVGSIVYLVLIALLSLGVATAVRESAMAIGLVLGLLLVFPFLAQVISDPAWRRHLEQIGPMTAGLAIQATTDLQSLPISPWAGLGVLAAWSAGALSIGGLVLCLRDA